MLKKYKIRDGFSFVLGCGAVKTGGAEIEIDDDTAANHIHKLELVVPVAKEMAVSAKKNKAKDESSELPLSGSPVTDLAAESLAPTEALQVTDPA